MHVKSSGPLCADLGRRLSASGRCRTDSNRLPDPVASQRLRIGHRSSARGGNFQEWRASKMQIPTSTTTRKQTSFSHEKSLIRNFKPFSAMPESDVLDIIEPANFQRYPRGESVFGQGDYARSFFFLLFGRLKVVQGSDDGRQTLVRIVHPGEIFGVAKALQRETYPASAIAVIESCALVWCSKHWDRIMSHHPAFAVSALQMVGSHVQEAHDRIRELSTEDVGRRVARAIIRLSAQAGRRSENGVLIDFPISLRDIGEMTGTTHFTVSRFLAAWQEAGVVSRSRQRLIVQDSERLRSLADGD